MILEFSLKDSSEIEGYFVDDENKLLKLLRDKLGSRKAEKLFERLEDMQVIENIGTTDVTVILDEADLEVLVENELLDMSNHFHC